MAQVSVIGLGAMGSTLARVLAERGHRVTAWNRSPLPATRAEALSRAGVAPAATPAAAIAASPADDHVRLRLRCRRGDPRWNRSR